MASKLGYDDKGVTNTKKVGKTPHTFLSWNVASAEDSFYERDGKKLTWGRVEKDVLAIYDDYGVSHNSQEESRRRMPLLISKLVSRIEELEAQVKELSKPPKK